MRLLSNNANVGGGTKPRMRYATIRRHNLSHRGERMVAQGSQKNTTRATATEAACEDINGVPQTALQLCGRKREGGAPCIMLQYD